MKTISHILFAAFALTASARQTEGGKLKVVPYSD
jgi:hypothetical protein